MILTPRHARRCTKCKTPRHKDIFLEIDWLSANCADPTEVHSHRPNEDQLKKIIQAFAMAPVDNPDNVPGISLHIDAGSQGGGNCINESTANQQLGTTVAKVYLWSEFDALKTDHFTKVGNPSRGRRAVYHYAIFAHELGGAKQDKNGVARAALLNTILGVEGSDFIVADQRIRDDCALSPYRTCAVEKQGYTLMHELGHNLGLRHGGGEDVNEKPNYLSVMNYRFGFGVLKQGSRGVLRVADYSRFDSSTIPSLKETSLNETRGLDLLVSLPYLTQWHCGGKVHAPGPVNGPLDWNCNGALDGIVEYDVNGDGAQDDLDTQNDWVQLVFKGGSIGDFAGSVVLPSETPIDGSLQELSESERKAIPQVIGIVVRPNGEGVVNCAQRAGMLTIGIPTLHVQRGEDYDFDATMLSGSSAVLSPGGAREAHSRGHREDFDGDGDIDLVLHFDLRDMALACSVASVELRIADTGGQQYVGVGHIR